MVGSAIYNMKLGVPGPNYSALPSQRRPPGVPSAPPLGSVRPPRARPFPLGTGAAEVETGGAGEGTAVELLVARQE